MFKFLTPLKNENRVIYDPQEMSELFVRSFSSVFSPVMSQVVNPHQESETKMRQIHLAMDKVSSQLNKLHESNLLLEVTVSTPNC